MLGGYVFQTAGLQFTTASKAAFITGCSVVLVPSCSFFFGRGIHFWIWSGAAVALVWSIPPHRAAGRSRSAESRRRARLSCAIMFALHIIFVGRYVERHPVGPSLSCRSQRPRYFRRCSCRYLPQSELDPPRLTWSASPAFRHPDHVNGFHRNRIFFPGVGATTYFSESRRNLVQSWSRCLRRSRRGCLAHESLRLSGLAGAALILVGILLAELRARPADGCGISGTRPVSARR